MKTTFEINGRHFEIVERHFKNGFSGEFLRIRDVLSGNISKCDLSYAYKTVSPQCELFWALRDLTQDVHKWFMLMEEQDILYRTKRKKSGPYVGVACIF